MSQTIHRNDPHERLLDTLFGERIGQKCGRIYKYLQHVSPSSTLSTLAKGFFAGAALGATTGGTGGAYLGYILEGEMGAKSGAFAGAIGGAICGGILGGILAFGRIEKRYNQWLRTQRENL